MPFTCGFAKDWFIGCGSMGEFTVKMFCETE